MSRMNESRPEERMRGPICTGGSENVFPGRGESIIHGQRGSETNFGRNEMAGGRGGGSGRARRTKGRLGAYIDFLGRIEWHVELVCG